MHLDFSTTFIITGVILGASSLSVLIFSFTRRENLIFLWATAAGLLLGAAFILGGLRGVISDLFSVIGMNVLILLGLTFFCELYSRLLSITFRRRFLLFLNPLIVLFLFYYFTFVSPDYGSRVIIFNISVLLPVGYLLTILLTATHRTQIKSHMLAFIPFLILGIISFAKLIQPALSMGTEFTSTFNFVHNTLSMLTSIWAMQSSVLLVGNRLQAQLEIAASTDPLTQTYNRRFLQESLMKELAVSGRTQTKLSIIICDLDHFKTVNDTYGHIMGDAVLVHTVGIYRKKLRKTDSLARYGGEEFLFVLPSTGGKEATAIAQELRAAMHSSPYLYESRAIPLTASFGIAEFDTENDDFDSLIHRADTALYEAKKEGRDRVFFLRG